MTCKAIGRSAGITISMALQAVNTYVTSSQWEGRVIMIEISWCPCSNRMTYDTICRELSIFMVGVSRVIEIILMTCKAVGRSAAITIGMALQTVHTYMTSCQWEGRVIMIEISWCPSRFSMADDAIRREQGACMIWICGRIEIIQVAAYAGIRSVIVVTVVAGGAVIGDERVSAIERIVLIVLRESCR